MDLRIYDTKNRIVTGLFACMKEKPLKDILNKDVIDEAQISSRTFYRYYSDKYAVLEEFEQEFINGLTKALEKDRESLSNLDHIPTKEEIYQLADSAFQHTLEFCIPYMRYGKILLSKNGDINFIWLIRETAEAEFEKRKKFLYGDHTEANSLIDKLYVGELISTIETWLLYSDDFSPKQIRTLLGEVQVLSPAELLARNTQ